MHDDVFCFVVFVKTVLAGRLLTIRLVGRDCPRQCQAQRESNKCMADSDMGELENEVFCLCVFLYSHPYLCNLSPPADSEAAVQRSFTSKQIVIV